MRTVDEYIDGLPEHKRIICSLIRDMLPGLVPGIREKLSFRIPFYYYFGMFLYLNETREGIDLGFCRGKDLVSAFPQLQLKQRAMVATVSIREKKDIARLELRQLIMAAAAWNEEAKRLKIPFIKKRAGRNP